MSMTFAEAIRSLGNTPEEVTKLFREKGIKGYRSSAGGCPVAMYLKSCGFRSVTVSNVAKRYESERVGEASETVDLPEGVRQWILDFDGKRNEEFNLYY